MARQSSRPWRDTAGRGRASPRRTREWQRSCPVRIDSSGRKSIELNLPQLAHALVHEPTHLSGDESGLRIHDLHGHRFGFELLEDVTKLLFVPVRRRLIGEKHSKTATVNARVQT